MMTAKEKIQRASAAVAFDGVFKYIKKNPSENLIKLIDISQKLVGGAFPEKNFDHFRKAVLDPENVWNKFALNIINNVDANVIKNMLLALGLGAGVNGTKAVRANREKYKCNKPFILLFDPTSACNMNCKGCWSAEYGNKSNLTLDEMRSIVNQGTELGTHFYMLTGGEPLIKKKEILTLCKENPDCAFLVYTNATLIDEALCEEMQKLGNITLALSIEGTEETNDFRRGEGAYKTTVEKMDMLKKYGLAFGVSICYTEKNVDAVTSDEFMDFIVDKGAIYAFYFAYMPVGHDAVVDLIPSPEKRVHMYKWLRKVRNSKTGKPIFVMDFQNDGEFVGGCIAGGRNYCHINPKGDVEPCVFIHFSGANIREKSLLECLKQPLFMAYRDNPPFNDNMLRPCPMLENPEILQRMVHETGAHSTDVEEAEPVEHLCGKCLEYAKEWKGTADKLWAEHPYHQKGYTNFKKK